MSGKLRLLIPISCFVVTNVAFALIVDWHHLQAHQLVGVMLTDSAFAGWITARLQLNHAPTSADNFVTTGLYARLRHPVYYFSVLTVLGISIFLWQIYLLPLLVALVALQGVRITKEEMMLKQTAGKAYADYKAQTWF